jgi:hypothetical protein
MTGSSSSAAGLSVAVQSNAAAFSKAIEDYAVVRGMVTQDALVKKGKDLMFRLFFGFMKVVPSEESVMSDVQKAGWRLKVGRIAKKLAGSRASGNSSVWGEIMRGPRSMYPASGIMRLLRIGKRGKPIYGGRRGDKGRAATADEGRALHRSDVHGSIGRKMSRREVEMFTETVLRLRGRRSLAISWLHRRKMNMLANVRRLYIINTKAEEKLQGRAAYNELRGDKYGPMIARLTLASSMPGVEKWPGVISNALARAVSDIGVYLQRHHANSLRMAINRRLKLEPIRRVTQWA